MKNISISTFGIYRDDEETVLQIDCSQSAKGYTHFATEPLELFYPTNNIGLEIGVVFGITINLNLQPEVIDNSYEIRIFHPEMEDSDTEYSYTKTSYTIDLIGLESFSVLYIFEEKFELQEGFWNFQLLQNNLVVVEKEFQTYHIAHTTEDMEDEKFFYDI